MYYLLLTISIKVFNFSLIETIVVTKPMMIEYRNKMIIAVRIPPMPPIQVSSSGIALATPAIPKAIARHMQTTSTCNIARAKPNILDIKEFIRYLKKNSL